MRRNSQLAEKLLTSQEGLCSMERECLAFHDSCTGA